MAQRPPETERNFISCPIVQDTATVPCWLSEYDGELYYLGIQTDISAEFDPPYLGHQALVEGTVSDQPRICGGIVLDPVRVSPLPEQDASCNLILPAVPEYTVPFAPRPPGPSGGRLAFQSPPRAGAPERPTPEARTFSIEYDFDTPVMGRHAAILREILDHAKAVAAPRISITGLRGATLLSNGQMVTERADIGELRAKEVEALLKTAGLTGVEYVVRWRETPEPADGRDDWKTRSTLVVVEP